MAEPNPNPELITDPLWRLWIDRPNLNWKLGGIFANKPHYHQSVNANLKNWPNSYSIRLPLDLVSENRNKARAIDLTMSDSEMIKWTTNMKRSAENSADHRLAPVKEFYGTLDGKTVFGMSKDSEFGPWERSTANLTHLWHGHCSIFTAFVNNWAKLSPVLSVWKGVSFSDWMVSTDMNLPEIGDSGQSVTYWQYVHNEVRKTVTPSSPPITIDGEYGPLMAKAVLDFWKKKGGQGDAYKGAYITGWLGMQYQKALADVAVPTVTLPNLPDDKLKLLVTDWLKVNVPSNLVITGEVEGRITLR